MNYKRWLNICDVPSTGTSSSTSGIKVRRPVHLLSELETTYFYIAERTHSIVDIREQWPILHIDETLRLCSSLGIKHAYREGYPEPFTIDFLLTEVVEGKPIIYRAASIKTAEDAKDPKVRQRLAVEFMWCQAHGIPWTLIDTSSFDRTVLETLRFLRSWFRNRYEPNEKIVDEFVEQFLLAYIPNVVLQTLIENIAKRLGIDQSTATNIFSFSAWSDRIPVSLRHPVLMNKPLVLNRFK
ncbi:TnsA endonuclease N-terminal domain-containing protein [Noviherbaspirillum suwonense]|nr:TnsA endonuclease N-terminal domain-containing protein [Noviherbaspirillum suwonense]